VLILLLPSTLLPAQTNNFVEAWFLYEQGKAKLDDPDGPELGEALLSFQEAIEKDPDYALAYAGLADAYSFFPYFGELPPRETGPKAKKYLKP